MSPRPRTVDDGALLAAAVRVMQRMGPARFTLAKVGAEAGVSAATLVVRFGSKRALLRRLSAAASGYSHLRVAELRRQHAAPLDVLREFLLCYAELARTPREMANHLAWLQVDFTDPVMLRQFQGLSRENLEITEALLREAEAAGVLTPVDAPALACALNAAMTGGLLAWATFREGSARAWLERDLDVLLAPWRARAAPTARRRGTPAR